MTRSAARAQFLADVLTTAIESGEYGWFSVIEYQASETAPTARIVADDDESGQRLVVDLATIAHGLQTIELAAGRPVGDDGQLVPHNYQTGARLYMSFAQRRAIRGASRANDAGELDVIDALAILECALFGAVTYA